MISVPFVIRNELLCVVVVDDAVLDNLLPSFLVCDSGGRWRVVSEWRDPMEWRSDGEFGWLRVG